MAISLMDSLNDAQLASARQFDRQSDRYGRTHILADTRDVAAAIGHLDVPKAGRALDVATGGGHTALWLARKGWDVTAGDISERMLENARRLLGEEGFELTTQSFAAEAMPFDSASFDLVTSRVAPHHFSSPSQFIAEAARVLKPGGYFLLIDGSVPDDDPETEAWLHGVEKWRDPSHGRFLSRKAWEDLVGVSGLQVLSSRLDPMKQPDLQWYFETAATTAENREHVLSAMETASLHVRSALRLGREDDKIVWWWPRLTLLARKPECG
ncbi:MAG TPA: class I SAM-dependent methyltransferase [Opitutaceae bacterium]|nr:class I SAM-dependent methyltransferase [Opitutaceae bacterium]